MGEELKRVKFKPKHAGAEHIKEIAVEEGADGKKKLVFTFDQQVQSRLPGGPLEVGQAAEILEKLQGDRLIGSDKLDDPFKFLQRVKKGMQGRGRSLAKGAPEEAALANQGVGIIASLQAAVLQGRGQSVDDLQAAARRSLNAQMADAGVAEIEFRGAEAGGRYSQDVFLAEDSAQAQAIRDVFKFHGGVGTIGGNRVILQDPNGTKVALDWGKDFSLMGKLFSWPDNLPRNWGDIVRAGLAPPVEGVSRWDWNDEAKRWVTNDEGPGLDAVFVSHMHADHADVGQMKATIPVVMGTLSKRLLDLRSRFSPKGFENPEGHITEGLQYQTDRTGDRIVLTEDGGRYVFRPTEGAGEVVEQENGFTLVTYGPKDTLTQDGPNVNLKRAKGKNVNVTGTVFEPHRVDHSVPGAHNYYISLSDGRTVLYTGDIRFHGRKHEYSEEFLEFLATKPPVDILLTEGTNITPHPVGYREAKMDSEAQVKDGIRRIVEDNEGELVVVKSAPVDFDRLLTVHEVAKETGRTLIVDSKRAAMMLFMNNGPDGRLIEAIPEVGDGPGQMLVMLNPSKRRDGKAQQEQYGPDSYTDAVIKYRLGPEKLLLEGSDVESEQFGGLPPKGFVWGVSSKEDLAAEEVPQDVLTREDILKDPGKYIVCTMNPDATLRSLIPIQEQDGTLRPGKIGGAFILSSSPAFNVEMELDQAKTEEWVQLAGMSWNIAHTSGHFEREGLKRIIQAARAKAVVPIHTESPESFAPLVEEVDLPEKPDIYLPKLEPQLAQPPLEQRRKMGERKFLHPRGRGGDAGGQSETPES